MRADLRDYRQIMESQQREKLDVRGHVDSEMREKLVEKNNQISDLLTQMTVRCLQSNEFTYCSNCKIQLWKI